MEREMQRLFVAAAVLAMLGGGSYAGVSRLSTTVLALAMCGGLALGLGVPALFAVLLLWRSVSRQQAEPPVAAGDPYGYAPPYATKPQIMVVPPMLMQAPTRQQAQATWAQTPGPRQYTIIGDVEGE
jgi:hypothetical protein